MKNFVDDFRNGGELPWLFSWHPPNPQVHAAITASVGLIPFETYCLGVGRPNKSQTDTSLWLGAITASPHLDQLHHNVKEIKKRYLKIAPPGSTLTTWVGLRTLANEKHYRANHEWDIYAQHYDYYRQETLGDRYAPIRYAEENHAATI